MKTTLYSIRRFPRVAALALLGVMAFPATTDAKPKDKNKGSKDRDSSTVQVQTARAASYDGRSSYGRYDRGRSHYHSHPSSSFTLSFGTGYLGRGYYYGPPGAAYYYERPGVRYYRNRYDVPGSYWGRGSSYGGYSYGGGADAAVQRELYRLGYYRGPIDGDIGPGSRRAIARFEADNGLPVRGYVSGTLLNALGIR